VNFTKWHGCGNDFILVDCLKEKIDDEASFAKKYCDRHFGIGADGLLMVLPSDKADIRMRIINADGSEAEMCGNGIRCFARYVHENNLVKDNVFSVETGAGILHPKMMGGELVEVDMGEPILEGDKVPVKGFGSNKIVNEDINVLGDDFKMTCVSMGNPHCVVFVDDAEKFPVEKYGHSFETHEYFPRKINTEFVEVKDDEHMRMRVWERGAAITLACGTGSCATLVAAVLNGKTKRKAEIALDGGNLTVEWREDNHLYMTGEARLVFAGELEGE